MIVSAGDILRLYDGTTAPPKQKWFLCVHISDGWFLRINTKSHWKPHFALSRSTDHILDHDCYIEMRGIIEYIEDEISEALRIPSNYIGRLSAQTVRSLIAAVHDCKTLTSEEKSVIIANLKASYGL